MRVIIYGVQKEKLEPLVKKSGFNLVQKNPEVVISFGGDGTLLKAEKRFPGIPKLLIKNSKVCKLCPKIQPEKLLLMLRMGKLRPHTFFKIEAVAHGRKITGLNEVVIHNQDPRRAIRFHVRIDGQEEWGGDIIGDGIIVATPFGSGGYFRSITDSVFRVGIGLAFNNSTEQKDHIILPDSSEITFMLARHKAILFADNDKQDIMLEEGDRVTIKKSSGAATILAP